MGETTVLNWTRVAWAIVATGCLLSGGCMTPRGNPPKTDGESLQVRWPPGRLIDLKFATINDAGFENAKHYCITYEEAGQSGEYRVLCGIEDAGDAGAKYYLTPRNQAPGQDPKPGPRGPGMRHSVGWSFITFRWPLIWVRNIDAGSIGTTAIKRWEEVNGVAHLSLFLVRDKRPAQSNDPTDPPDPSAGPGLFLSAGYPVDSEKLHLPDGQEIVRVRFYEQGGVSNRMVPIMSSPGVWEKVSFQVTEDASGAVAVSATEPAGEADCAFLAGVLQRAREAGIYRLPGEQGP